MGRSPPELLSSCTGSADHAHSLHGIIAAVADGSLSPEDAIGTIEEQCSADALPVCSRMHSLETRVTLIDVEVPAAGSNVKL